MLFALPRISPVKTTLEVNSPHLKSILRSVIRYYPGIMLNTKSTSLDMPCPAPFFFRHGLKKAGEKLAPGTEASIHFSLLFQSIEQRFGQTVTETANLRDQALISFEYLWTIFQPSCIIFSVVLGQPRAFRL